MPNANLAMQAACENPQEMRAHGEALRILQDGGMSPMVGGAYALRVHTGYWRDTKDLDLFLRKDCIEAALAALAEGGYRVEMTDPLWIAKAFLGDYFIDLIFSSGNGVATVDDRWVLRAPRETVLGLPSLIVTVEDIIWQKAFIQERERFDGADIHHLLRCKGAQLDWRYLLERFGTHWPVLLSHLVMFRFAFPGSRDQIPSWVMDELLGRAAAEELRSLAPQEAHLCRGTLVSRQQYLWEVNDLGFRDARELEVEGWQGDSRWPVKPRSGGRDPLREAQEGEDDANRSRG